MIHNLINLQQLYKHECWSQFFIPLDRKQTNLLAASNGPSKTYKAWQLMAQKTGCLGNSGFGVRLLGGLECVKQHTCRRWRVGETGKKDTTKGNQLIKAKAKTFI